MKNHRQSPGKIEDQGSGLGVPSPEQVEERAIELAKIDGRASVKVTDADREQARRELTGESTDSFPPEGPALANAASWSEPPGSIGHKTPDLLPDDESTHAERLVEEGLDEALHDKMLEAQKKNIDEAS